MEHMGQSNIVSWLKPTEHFKFDESSQKRVMLLELADASEYSWLDAEVFGTSFILNMKVVVDVVDIMVDDLSDLSIFPMDSEK